MQLKNFKLGLFAGVFAVSLSSCFDDLNRTPRYDISTEDVFGDPANYIHALAKVYGGLTIEGNDGGGGRVDIAAFDAGASTYSRSWWLLQEIPTDEAIVAWRDQGLPELNTMNFNSLNSFVEISYNRIFFQIALINEFVRNSSDQAMDARGFSEADQNRIRQYRAEARFLRALCYWHAIDLFANVPLIKEDFLPGSRPPQQSNRVEIFNYVEAELLDILPALAYPQADRNTYYARATKGAAWMVLAKLYLNAQVYTGTPRWSDAATYAAKVINEGGYSLEPNYRHLFMADNHVSPELIFALPYDGLRTRSYGGTTFLMNACIGGSGISTSSQWAVGWAGIRTRREFVNLFPDSTADNRFTFFTNRSKNISNIGSFIQGWPTLKWRNRTRNDAPGSDPQRNFSDIDFPMFRLADAHLMYAEAAVRGGGDVSLGVNYFNALRERAYGDASRNIGVGQLTLQAILDERARELYYEGHRRTDLIRYNLFTSPNYVWQWKGNDSTGVGVSDHLNIYPLPASDLVANPNLQQNPGYGN